MDSKLPSYQHLPLEDFELRYKNHVDPNPLSASNPRKAQNSSRWRLAMSRLGGVGLHSLPVLSISALVAAVALVATSAPQTVSTCDFDGEFDIYRSSQGNLIFSTASYQPWNTNETFSINLGFGSMPFGTAKLIDVIWDVVIGRAGQAVLAALSYRVFNSALARSMETGSVSNATFEAVALQAGSARAIYKITSQFKTNVSLRRKAFVAWMVVSALIVIILPTLASAMTGYSANFDAFVQTRDGERLPLSDFDAIFYIIHDGSRLGTGFYDEYPVMAYNSPGDLLPDYACPNNKSSSLASSLEQCCKRWISPCSSSAPGKIDSSDQSISLQWDNMIPGCSLLWGVSEYTFSYGFWGSTNGTSIFYNHTSQTNITLPGPTLNISAQFYFDTPQEGYLSPPMADPLLWSVLPYGPNWPNATGYVTDYDPPTPYFKTNQSSQVFDDIDMQTNGTCQQPGPVNSGPATYRWGFSVQLLTAWFSMLLIWAIGMYAVHLDTYLNGNQDILRRDMGLKRAVLDLAAAYQKEIQHGETSMLGDQKLRQAIGEGTITYAGLVAQSTTTKTRLQGWRPPRWVPRWIRRKRYYISIIVASVVLTVIIILAVELSRYKSGYYG